MREITDIREIQKIALDILLYLDKICKKNNLKYFISDGTLLGAVRHKGFIPWDDDLDVWMPRTDYERIVDIINNEAGKYKIINFRNTSGYIYPFAKIIDTRTRLVENIDKKCMMGIYVDIFPYDGLPGKNPKEYAKFVKQCMFLQWQRIPAFSTYKTVVKKSNESGVKQYLKWFARKVVTGKNILRLIDWWDRRYPVEGASFVGALGSGYKEKDMMPSWICEKTVELEFEGHMVSAPIGYREFLEIEYGDYMRLPPIEEQVTHHDFKAWWIKDKEQ